MHVVRVCVHRQYVCVHSHMHMIDVYMLHMCINVCSTNRYYIYVVASIYVLSLVYMGK